MKKYYFPRVAKVKRSKSKSHKVTKLNLNNFLNYINNDKKIAKQFNI